MKSTQRTVFASVAAFLAILACSYLWRRYFGSYDWGAEFQFGPFFKRVLAPSLLVGVIIAIFLRAATRPKAGWDERIERVQFKFRPSATRRDLLTLTLEAVPAASKIRAIKLVRALTGAGLREAKDLWRICRRLSASRSPWQRRRRSASGSRRLAPKWADRLVRERPRAHSNEGQPVCRTITNPGERTMKLRTAALAVVLLLGVAAVVNAAQSKSVQTMAAILLHLQHYPDDADKQSLQQIIEDSSATMDERTVAQALMDVRHTVAAADKPKLEAIVGDDKAASSVKSLASIILSLHHMPSESDKEKLKALAT
jgi:hypothetical protein